MQSDNAGSPAVAPADTSSLNRRIFWKLMPLLILVYTISFLDRTNIALAKHSMSIDLGLSAATYGLGAGLFFLSYASLEIPSNLLLHRVGARFWITRIMITWGALSSAMAFVQGPTSFYLLRLLLGAAEAGLFPGVILYLTYWFDRKDCARATGYFLLGVCIANVIGGPIGGPCLNLMVPLACTGGNGFSSWKACPPFSLRLSFGESFRIGRVPRPGCRKKKPVILNFAFPNVNSTRHTHSKTACAMARSGLQSSCTSAIRSPSTPSSFSCPASSEPRGTSRHSLLASSRPHRGLPLQLARRHCQVWPRRLPKAGACLLWDSLLWLPGSWSRCMRRPHWDCSPCAYPRSCSSAYSPCSLASLAHASAEPPGREGWDC